MIRLQSAPKPTQLTDALVEELTNQFLDDSAKRVWDKPYITDTLSKMSSAKCCYCECRVNEESKYMEVEHFFPKKIYPGKVVEWENLLPVCKRCNINKGDHDTGKEPIVHPVNDDPQTHFALRAYRFYAKTSIGKISIAVLNLNDFDQLQIKRFEVGAGVKKELDELEVSIEDFLKNQTTIRRTRICSKLRGIMYLGQQDKEYSATVATEILREPSYHFAKTELHKLDLWDEEFERLENGLLKIAYL